MFVIRSSITQSGLGNFYVDSALFMRQMSYALVRIGSYEKIKQRLSHNGKPSTSQLLFAAGFAGALGAISGNSSGALFADRLNTNLMPIHSCPHDERPHPRTRRTV